MIVQFKHESEELSTGIFDGNLYEIRKTLRGRWAIHVNGAQKDSGSFNSREQAIRRIENSAQEVIALNMPVAKAQQKSLSPAPTRFSRPYIKRSAPFSNKRS